MLPISVPISNRYDIAESNEFYRYADISTDTDSNIGASLADTSISILKLIGISMANTNT